jgi:hypothetical protein
MVGVVKPGMADHVGGSIDPGHDPMFREMREVDSGAAAGIQNPKM